MNSLSDTVLCQRNFASRSYQLPSWIVTWLIISISIIFWDVMFVLLRPHTFSEGCLGLLWLPYAKYIKIDTSYADMNNSFVIAQAIMSLFEMVIVLIALYFNYLQKWMIANLFAFSSQLLTGTKTILIFILELVSGLQHVSHNKISELLTYYIIPNTIWIILPLWIVIVLGRTLISCKSH